MHTGISVSFTACVGLLFSCALFEPSTSRIELRAICINESWLMCVQVDLKARVLDYEREGIIEDFPSFFRSTCKESIEGQIFKDRSCPESLTGGPLTAVCITYQHGWGVYGNRTYRTFLYSVTSERSILSMKERCTAREHAEFRDLSVLPLNLRIEAASRPMGHSWHPTEEFP